MSELHCPKCACDYCYHDGEMNICPECAYEWRDGDAGAGDDTPAVLDANGVARADGASAGSQSSSGAGSSDHNEVVVGAGSSQDAKGRTSAAERPSAQSVRERWLPVTGVAIGVLSVAAILLSAGLIVLRLRRA